MSDPIVTTFTFKRDEYILAMKRHFKTALHVQRDVIGGIAAIAGGLYLAFTYDSGWFAWLLVALGTVLLAMVTVPIVAKRRRLLHHVLRKTRLIRDSSASIGWR